MRWVSQCKATKQGLKPEPRWPRNCHQGGTSEAEWDSRAISMPGSRLLSTQRDRDANSVKDSDGIGGEGQVQARRSILVCFRKPRR